MKSFFTRIILLVSLLIGFHQARADHMVGSDITWKCLGGDTFQIIVTAYRDCNGIPFPNTPITLKPLCSGGKPITLNGNKSGGDDITPVCKKACTRCKPTFSTISKP